MSATPDKLNWIVTPWQPAGLAVGDFVSARADPDEDSWTGTIHGTITRIVWVPREPYVSIDIGDGVVWDVNVSQVHWLSGRRRVSLYLNRDNQLNGKFSDEVVPHGAAAYAKRPMCLFELDMGFLTVRVHRADSPVPVPAAGYHQIFTGTLTFDAGHVFWDADVPLFREVFELNGFGKTKPTEASLELVHPGREPWGWEQAFPLQHCSANNMVYACVGELNDLPDIEDMTKLEDDT